MKNRKIPEMKEENGGKETSLPSEGKECRRGRGLRHRKNGLCLQGGDNGVAHFRRVHADFSGRSRSQVARAEALVNDAADGGVNGVCRGFSPRE